MKIRIPDHFFCCTGKTNDASLSAALFFSKFELKPFVRFIKRVSDSR